jgi:hypothetical protein
MAKTRQLFVVAESFEFPKNFVYFAVLDLKLGLQHLGPML